MNKIDNNDVLLKEQVKLQNKHIFDDLCKNFNSELSKEKLLELYYYMSISENALNYYRAKEFKQADKHFNSLLNFEKSFVEPIKDGMFSLHNSLSSYKHYVEEDYDLALYELDEAINLAIKQSHTFPYFVSIIAEQWLNKIRVYIKLGNINETIFQTIALNKFLIFGIHQNKTVSKNINAVPIEHRIQMSTHVINSIDFAFNKAFDKQIRFYDIISKEIVCKKQDQIINIDLKNAYEIIMFKNSDTLTFLKNIETYFQSIIKIPKALQKYIFSEFLNICNEQNFEISKHENNKYFSETLRFLNINHI